MYFAAFVKTLSKKTEALKETQSNLLPGSQQIDAEVLAEKPLKHRPVQQTPRQSVVVQQLFQMVGEFLKSQTKLLICTYTGPHSTIHSHYT